VAAKSAEKRALDAILVTAFIKQLPSGQEQVFLCDLRVSAFYLLLRDLICRCDLLSSRKLKPHGMADIACHGNSPNRRSGTADGEIAAVPKGRL
jgi:hypothetical protein